jgi:uncharacterized protein YqeY
MNAATFKQRLRADLKAAMIDKQAGRTRVLRQLIAALDNAEAVPVPNRRAQSRARPGGSGSEVARLELDAGAVATVLAAEIEARRAASAEYRLCGRAEEAAALVAEIELIGRYLGDRTGES